MNLPPGTLMQWRAWDFTYEMSKLNRAKNINELLESRFSYERTSLEEVGGEEVMQLRGFWGRGVRRVGEGPQCKGTRVWVERRTLEAIACCACHFFSIYFRRSLSNIVEVYTLLSRQLIGLREWCFVLGEIETPRFNPIRSGLKALVHLGREKPGCYVGLKLWRRWHRVLRRSYFPS